MKSLAIAPHPAPLPLIGVDYIIEIAGPNPVPAEASRALLTKNWQDPLGSPKVWGMGMMDNAWRPVAPDESVSLDSLGLSWRLWAGDKPMTRQGAETLHRNAEAFANQIGRRALAIPTPDQVEGRVNEIEQIRESLDVGFNLDLVPRSGILDLGRVRSMALAEGWRETADGYDWRQAGWPFELAGMFVTREVVSVGFRVAISPLPKLVGEELLDLMTRWADELDATLLDEEGGLLDRGAVLANLEEATRSLVANGVPPGSAAALAVFEG